MTVQDLIDKLQAIVAKDPAWAKAKVLTEGCDCTGHWDGRVRKVDYEHAVELTRDDSWDSDSGTFLE